MPCPRNEGQRSNLQQRVLIHGVAPRAYLEHNRWCGGVIAGASAVRPQRTPAAVAAPLVVLQHVQQRVAGWRRDAPQGV